MASIAELLKDKPYLPGNFFAYDSYIQADFELGMLQNRSGARLLALPDTLLNVLYSGLEYELGGATSYVLYQCGYQWGKTFYRRFAGEVSEYYGQPLAQMGTLEFVQCLKEAWKTCGWGILDLDFEYHEQGFLLIQVQNSVFTKNREAGSMPQAEMESGLLASFFSQLTGQPLQSVQTACESMGSPLNRYVLGLADRVKPLEAWVEEGQDHNTVMMRLTQKDLLEQVTEVAPAATTDAPA